MSKQDVIVIGGSIAGCLAAAAAVRAGARVRILERDEAPEGPVARKGVAQGRQLHGLLEGGRLAAEALLPGLSQDLAAQGSRVVDSCANVRWYHGGVWKMQPIDKPLYCQTRPFFEWRVREAVARLAGVTFQHRAPVSELVHDAGAVRGVRLGSGDVLHADVVIDASGRGTALPRWLEALGYGRVSTRRASLGLTYVSGMFSAPPRELLDGALMIYPEPPHQKRAGLAMRVEGDRCIVTLQGYHGEKPDTELPGFRHYARGLAQPELAALLDAVEPLGELVKHTFPFQVRYAYEELPRFPRGLVPIGDAVASVDPVYGQGMSVAAMESLELVHWLAAGEVDARAVAAIASVAAPAWFMTTLEASRWPMMQGEAPPAARVIGWYVDQVLKACADSETAVRAFYDVMHLTADLQSLTHPELLARVFWPNDARAMTADAAQLMGLAVATLANPGSQQVQRPEQRYKYEPMRHFRVRQDALHKCEVVSGPVSRLQSGQAMLRVRQFALTSNNISYALVGRQMGYFAFYPTDAGWGCLPAWGFAEVVDSRHPGLAEGEMLYGFLPMASHWLMSAGAIDDYTVSESSPHRAGFLPLYNTYFRMAQNPLFHASQRAEWSLFWPLFMTAFSLAAELNDAGLGHGVQVIISSASSKTALCLASILATLGSGCSLVGLTSSKHAGFVSGTGLYDQVIGYEDVANIPRTAAMFVDVAGHSATLSSVHRVLGDALKRSVMLGATNWHGFHGLAPDATLPGPAPSFFFAPEHIAKRFAQWGLPGFLERSAPAWTRFLATASSWLRVKDVRGERELLAAYLQAFGGQLDPRDGIVVSL